MKSTTLSKLLRSLRLLALVVFATSFAWTNPASATLLPAGTPSTTPITAVPGLLGGGALIDTVSTPFTSPSAVFSGTLLTNVIRNDSGNPFGAASGYLSFAYQLSNEATSADPLEGLTLSDFRDPVTLLPFTIDVSYDTPLLGATAPATMGRIPSGKIVSTGFLLNGGNTLATIVIHTSLKNYRPGVAAVINSETASPIATFVPIPEPSSLVLAALGLSAILVGKRRRS